MWVVNKMYSIPKTCIMQVAEREQTTAVKHLSIGEKKNNIIFGIISPKKQSNPLAGVISSMVLLLWTQTKFCILYEFYPT